MTYQEEIKLSYDFFDTIDFLQFIPESTYWLSIDEIMSEIEQYYNHHLDLPTIFEGYIFNFINKYEFMEYLKDRYNFPIKCKTIYYIKR